MHAKASPLSDSAHGVIAKSPARFVPIIARILLGLPFLAAGTVGFIKPMQPPPEMAQGAKDFFVALNATGYMLQLICATQLIVGILLIINRFVPLALVLIAPFLVNALAFHIFLEHSGLPIAAIFVALEIFLLWTYRRAYAPLFTPKSTPTLQ